MDSPGKRLREERQRLKANQTTFGVWGGVDRKSQFRYETDQRAPDSEYLHALSKHGVDVLYVLTGKRSSASATAPSARPRDPSDGPQPPPGEFVYFPRFSVEAAAGAGAVNHAEDVVEMLAFRRDWVRRELRTEPKNLVLISVRGDSMAPTLEAGDVILVDSAHVRVETNAIYAFVSDEQGLRVKRLQRRDDGSMVVKSDNPAYEPEVLSKRQAAGMVVTGRVVWMGRRL